MIRPFSRPLCVVSLATVLALSPGACASHQGVDDTAPAPAAGTAAPGPGTPVVPATSDASAQCHADAAQPFAGRDATETTVAEAQAAAGATGAVRVIKPGQPVTMDFRGDRLNVEVDEHNAIVRISCG